MYGSLEELVKDPGVDVVYVSSITSAHYANVKTCLEARKPVLCEVNGSLIVSRSTGSNQDMCEHDRKHVSSPFGSLS